MASRNRPGETCNEGTSSSSTPKVWDAFDRGSAAGRALFKLYSDDFGGKKAGNSMSRQNRDVYQKAVGKGKIIPQERLDPSRWGKNEAKGPEPKVAVPIVRGAPQQLDPFENPGRPGYGYGKRTAEDIQQEMKQLEIDIRSTKPQPSRSLIGDKEKTRYARKLEFNGRPPEEMPEGHFKKPAPPKKLSRSEELEKLFDDVTAEIEERHQFLADMEKMGQKAKYEAQIMGEVAVRLKQLKKLDAEIKLANAKA